LYIFYIYVYVMFMVTLGFVLFNAADLNQAMGDIAGMFGFAGVPLVNQETLYYLGSYGMLFVMGFIGATPIVRDTARKLADHPKYGTVIAFVEPIFLLGLLLVCTAYLVDGSFSPFLYFRF
jgi:alginate O-acetyltransferase complex protein AlgI